MENEKIIEENNRKKIFVKACKESANTFVASSTYGVLRTAVTSFLSHQKFSIAECVSSALQEGVNFTAFPCAKGVASAAVGKEIDDLKPYLLVPAYAALSVASSVAMNAVKMPKKKDEATKKETNEIDFQKFAENVKNTAISTTGFNIAHHYVGAALPHASTEVEKYLNSSVSILAGNAAGVAASIPVLMKDKTISAQDVALGYILTVPLVFVDNAIYFTAGELTEPLRLK